MARGGREEESRQEEAGQSEAGQEEAGQEQYQHIAEPQHLHMSTLINAMKAILGYTPVKLPEGQDDLTVGGVVLKDLRIAFCLCGAKELWHAD